MGKSAKMVLVLALFAVAAAISAVPCEGRAVPKAEEEERKAYHPNTFSGGLGGGVFAPGINGAAPGVFTGGTVFGPLVPGGFGFGSTGTGNIPGFVPPSGGLGRGVGGTGGVGQP